LKHIKQLYTFIFISIVLAIAYLFFSTAQIQKTLNKNVENIFIQGAKSFAENINEEITTHIKNDPYKELKKNPQMQKRMEHALSIIVNETYKYIFVLYKDKNGNYRYLLDGSKDKARFNQRLSVDKELWDKVYTTKTPLVINQKKLDNLWITYLKPVVMNHKTVAIIALDFSAELPQDIYHAIKPLNKIFLYIFISIGLLIFILIYQSVANIKIKKDSITDPLTQAYNRNYLRDLLKNINIAKYQIMMLDIDHFKQVNDNYGHKTGDHILANTARIIQNEIREDDMLIRFGGEEFLIFIKKSLPLPSLAYDIGERIRKKIEMTHFNYEDKELQITLSIGVACQPEHFKTVSLAIKHADEMLYIAKREGRNQVISHATHQENSPESDKRSINDVKAALEEKRIICFYQAIYNAKTNTIIKYEALVRMREKDGSITPPMRFLESIMYTNVYNDLTKTVLDNVFTQIKKKKIQISTNLNFSDILDNKIFDLIIAELQEHKELSSWLIIELLEYELIEEITIIQNRLLQIKEFGVKIAIDDFGSGYANYSIFKQLPIDILKIDGSLIKDIDTSETSYKITHSIAVLAKELGITTVAEFVHSKEVLECVKTLHIDELQGFYLAKPSPDIL